jgi:hypothetical protein
LGQPQSGPFMLIRLGLAAVLMVGATRQDLAQTPAGGTATMHITGHLPDSLKQRLPMGMGLDALDMTVTYATDGSRIGAVMAVNLGSAMPTMAGMSVHVVIGAGSDTVRLGIVLPPEAASMMGGGSGIEMDLPLNAIPPIPMAGIDSAFTKLAVTTSARSLNTSSKVAGIRCEEWEVIVGADTSHQCLVATPPIVSGLQRRLFSSPALSQLQAVLGTIAGNNAKLFGGREMTAIRSSSNGMHMELVDFKPGTPDPALLTLPAGLKSMGGGMPGFGG